MNLDYKIYFPENKEQAISLGNGTRWWISINNKAANLYDKWTKAILLKPYIIHVTPGFLKKSYPAYDLSKILILVDDGTFMMFDKLNKNVLEKNSVLKKLGLSLDDFPPFTVQEKSVRLKEWDEENTKAVKEEAQDSLTNDLKYEIIEQLVESGVYSEDNIKRVTDYLRKNNSDLFEIKIVKNEREAKARFFKWDSLEGKEKIKHSMVMLNMINESKKNKKPRSAFYPYFFGYAPHWDRDRSDDVSFDDGFDDGGDAGFDGGGIGENYKGKFEMKELLNELAELLKEYDTFDQSVEEDFEESDEERYERTFSEAEKLYNESIKAVVANSIVPSSNIDNIVKNVVIYLDDKHPEFTYSAEMDDAGRYIAQYTNFETDPEAEKAVLEALYVQNYLKPELDTKFAENNPKIKKDKIGPEIPEVDDVKPPKNLKDYEDIDKIDPDDMMLSKKQKKKALKDTLKDLEDEEPPKPEKDDLPMLDPEEEGLLEAVRLLLKKYA